MRKSIFCVLVGGMILGGYAYGSVVYDFSQRFANDDGSLKPAPDGTSPWLTATFENAENGKVRLTLDASAGLTKGFVTDWYFNYTLEGQTDKLIFEYKSGVVASSIKTSKTQGGTTKIGDAFKADGVGYYDFEVDFAQNDNELGYGHKSVYLISLESGSLLEGAFVSQSEYSSAAYYAAAHVQGITAGSTWIGDSDGNRIVGSVPDGGVTASLLGLAMLAVSFVRRLVLH
jgi:hypothetical protein